MKIQVGQNFALLLSALFFAATFSSCLKDDCKSTSTFIQYTPVYKKVDEIRQDIKVESPRELTHPGKIYFYQNFLFINELREGIHVIDNANPASPVNVAFIKIPGNLDMAVRNDILFADNYIDLLCVDIKDPLHPAVLGRTLDVFPSIGLNVELGHLVYYEETPVTQTFDCNSPQFGNSWFLSGDIMFVKSGAEANFDSNTGQFNANQTGQTATGVGGSMNRFTVIDQYLYTVDEFNLNIFDLAGGGCPSSKTSTLNVGWGIETIFPYEDKLFIGSSSGMFIFDNSNPLAPKQLSLFAHATACDPVFVDGDFAYVTLRDGTPCESFSNQLDVVDISNLTNPSLVKTYPMTNPHGLSIRDNILYLCDGRDGLKVYGCEDKLKIDQNFKAHVTGTETYDVIALPGSDLLFVVGKGGFFQYDASDPANPKLVSSILVKN